MFELYALKCHVAGHETIAGSGFFFLQIFIFSMLTKISQERFSLLSGTLVVL